MLSLSLNFKGVVSAPVVVLGGSEDGFCGLAGGGGGRYTNSDGGSEGQNARTQVNISFTQYNQRKP